jgi:hypothetical protein
MADVAAIVTIVVFFVSAAFLTRPLDRVIAEADDGAREADEDNHQHEESRAARPAGPSA